MANNRIIIAIHFDNDPQPPATSAAQREQKPVIRLLSRFKIGSHGKVVKVFGENLAEIRIAG